jgi:hypothetical protein
LNHDNRVNSTDILCKNIAPDKKLKQKKVDFKHSDFWFIKGHEQMVINEMDSAIDSYRQAIRLACADA